VWSNPAHPYSEALVAAIPRPDGGGLLPESLPGEVPDPANPPSGCRFHPRCPYAFDRCPVEEPPLLRLQGGRAAACWLQSPGEPPTPLPNLAGSGHVQ
jgi:peptide/nickel transport system ATP-binding protein